MKNLKFIFHFFDKNLFSKALFLIFLIFLNAFAESFSIALLIPIIIFFFKSDFLQLHPYWASVIKTLSPLNYFGSFELETIMIGGLLSIFFIFFLVRIFFNISFIIYKTKFMNALRAIITKKTINGYFYTPNNFFSNKNHSNFVFSSFFETSHAATSLSLIFIIFAEILVVTSIILVLLFYQAKITSILIGIIFISSFTIIKLLNTKIKIFSFIRKTEEENNLRKINELFSGLNEIKSYKASDYFINSYISSLNKFLRTYKFQEILPTFSKIWFEIVIMTSIIFILFYMGSENYSKIMIVSTLALYMTSALRILPSLNKIISSIQSLSYLKPYVTSLQNDFNNFIIKNNLENKNKIFYIKKFNSLSIRNLNLEYSKNSLIFDNADIEIFKNDIIGICGESGSGKTSFIKMIAGQMPIKCDISVDNKKNTLNYHYLDLGKISYVPQNVHILNESIYNNIALGINDNDINFEKVQSCVEQCQLSNFVRSKKNGLKFIIEEKGSNLSEGQIQRIGIARALYYEPEFLIFDESTNALDSKNETLILNVIKNVSKNKTVFFISHEKRVLNFCNKIFKIENKKIYVEK
jgi:ABC-type multidrug transport system fused ATPase/permease subunit